MANLCNRCGQPLPGEDVRFCNRCGADVSPKASSSPIPRRAQAIAGQNSSPAPGVGTERAGARPALREQIAFAPSTSSATPAPSDDVPPWLSKLDKLSAPSVSRPRTQSFSPDTPPGVENPLSKTEHPSSAGGTRVPQRELRTRVWEGGEADSSDLEQMEAPSEVEDLPTVPVPSAPAGEKVGRAFSSAAQREQPTRASEEERGDADLPTRPLVAHLAVLDQVHTQRTSERPFPAQSYRQTVSPQSLPGQTRDQQQGFSVPVSPNPVQPPIRQQSMTPAPPLSSPGFQQPAATQAPVTAEKAAGPVPARPVRRKSKMRLVVVLVLLLVLLGGGLVYWLVAYQPFSVPAITSTSLSFSNASLGIALQYPQGWTNQLDSAHQTISFFDVGHVDQLTISVTSSNGASASTYASKEAARLGLTAQKNLLPITFAGTTWQRVQGTLLVSGATDTETVLVAQHRNHLYAIAQIAPAVTYTGADSLFFSIFRAHFQFL